jgi:hypothetical protein
LYGLPSCSTLRPAIPIHVHPVVALVAAGVEMDVLDLTDSQYSDAERETVVSACPCMPGYKEDIFQAFYDGIRHKPDAAFRNVKAYVIADRELGCRKGSFCSINRTSCCPGCTHAVGCGQHG